MRLLFSSFSFLATMVVGAIAFAFTAIEFPTIMRDLIAAAGTLPSHLAGLGIGDRYMVWLDILLTGDKLVLLGFILVTRIVFAVVTGIITGGEPSHVSGRQGQGSVFSGWGKS